MLLFISGKSTAHLLMIDVGLVGKLEVQDLKGCWWIATRFRSVRIYHRNRLSWGELRFMGMRFNAPPGWPAPPAGWSPPPGWSPDPSWRPAPYGWPFWLDDGAVRRRRYRVGLAFALAAVMLIVGANVANGNPAPAATVGPPEWWQQACG